MSAGVVVAAVSAVKTVEAGVSPAILPTARLLCARRAYSASRILDTTQIRRLIAFSSATDLTIQRFNESRQRSEMFRRDPIFLIIGNTIKIDASIAPIFSTGKLGLSPFPSFHVGLLRSNQHHSGLLDNFYGSLAAGGDID